LVCQRVLRGERTAASNTDSSVASAGNDCALADADRQLQATVVVTPRRQSGKGIRDRPPRPILDLLYSDRFFGASDATDGAHIPLAGYELPEKSAVLLRYNSLVVNKPLHVAGHRCREFNHLL
jgi:hypothetical protein